jgi:diguanylate cyclase (GGDEF)-like protein
MEQRVAELEVELYKAAERARYFGAAAAATVALSQINEPDHIVAALLDFISNLGFQRVAYFDQAKNDSISSHILDRSPRLTQGPAAAAFLLSKRNDPAGPDCRVKVGGADDLSAPIADVRGWYVFAPICSEADRRKFLYADDHDAARSDNLFAELFSILTGVAAAALRAADSYERVRLLARSDPLTGLLNRRAFYEKLGELLAGCGANGKQCAAVLVDIDDLKSINDVSGHQAGDATLGHVARALLAAARPGDVVARLAGDEFVITIPDCESGMARGLVRRFSRELRSNGLRCSLGAALSRRDDHPESLLARADEALYSVKKAGKNGFAFADTSISSTGFG